MDTMEIDDTIYVENHLITQVNFHRRNRLLRRVTVCLGILCAALLFSNIGQFIFYESDRPASAAQTQASYDALTQDKETLQNDKDNLTAARDRLQSSYDALSEEKRRLQTTLSDLTKERDELQQSCNSSITERDEMKAGLSRVRKERDRLQTGYNNLTAAAEQLQTNYSNLQRVKDALSTLITALRIKEVQLESNYTSLKREKEQLQISHNTLNRSITQINTSYNSLWKDKDQLQTRYNTLRKEKEQLQTSCSRLTAAGEELQKKINKMTAKLRGMPCQTHWTKFDVSCYFVSTLKKNWTESRRACIAEGADLLVIDSSEEQLFVNGLLDKGQSQNAWIGLTDSLAEGVWTWVDGTPVTTAYWLPGQPNDFKNQDCGEYVSSDVGSWNDDGCFAVQHWICEK
ncbi:CD209 antigen-like [Archocentrus centrarchus]|uniref:CD209 antigen-like n=1 Tax=Archocentrus centrarchus TaxID=63155 RepID=UPI0011E9BE24|nr:CD209 antigen-like [Archocentrus centrarchus]